MLLFGEVDVGVFQGDVFEVCGGRFGRGLSRRKGRKCGGGVLGMTLGLIQKIRPLLDDIPKIWEDIYSF